MGPTENSKTRYAAFISYAHADEVMAARLHKALETYPVPKHLSAQGKATKPVFRDVAELTAAHSLSEKIKDAVKGSRVLIVLCSPAAKASHWVNEEVRLFRELHGEAAILSAIIEGTPETSFPAALVEGGREPLAATLRSDKAGFKLGVTQLAAGILGTGLDDLIQRGAKRRQRILGAGLAVSLLFSGAMGFTAYQAVEARNEAVAARGDAEGLVEYMIKDLKFKLEPVGRLDLLEGIGGKAVEYYDKRDIKTLPDDSLTRQAAARQVLAQVHLDAGRMQEAQKEIEVSAALTREVLSRNPEDTDAIYAHAQSEFWVGKFYFDQNKYAQVEPFWQEYDRLSQALYESNPNHFDWTMEAVWSANAMGAYYDRKKDYVRSQAAFEKAAEYAKLAIAQQPDNSLPRSELANILAGQFRATLYVETFENILPLLQEQREIYRLELERDPQNNNLIYNSHSTDFMGFYDFTKFHEVPQIESFKQAIKGFTSLAAMDPQNTVWADRNISAKISLLDYYYQNANLKKFDELYPEFVETFLALPKSENEQNQSREFIEFSYKINNIRNGFVNGLMEDSHRDLMTLNAKHYNRTSNRPIDGAIYSTLMIENNAIELSDEAKQFAKKYLSLTPVKAIVQKPSVLFNKSIAYTILGDCDTASRDAQNLTNRGFISPPIYQDNCQSKN